MCFSQVLLVSASLAPCTFSFWGLVIGLSQKKQLQEIRKCESCCKSKCLTGMVKEWNAFCTPPLTSWGHPKIQAQAASMENELTCALTTSLACWEHLFWVTTWASWIDMIISTPVMDQEWDTSARPTCLNSDGMADSAPVWFSIGPGLRRHQISAAALIVISSAIASRQNLKSHTCSFLTVFIILEPFRIPLCFFIEVRFFLRCFLYGPVYAIPRNDGLHPPGGRRLVSAAVPSPPWLGGGGCSAAAARGSIPPCGT